MALLLTLQKAKAVGLSPSKYRVLLTKVPPPPETDGPELRAQLEAASVPVFRSDIPRLKSFDKAAQAGVPVHAIKDGTSGKRAWAAYEDVAREIAALLGLPQGEGELRHG